MRRFKGQSLVLLVMVAVLVFASLGIAAKEQYPSRTANVIVFSSAGGGTDVIARYLSTQMEKLLKQKMIVSNMPGGLGGTAAEYVWQQKHDGYTILGVSETATTFLVNNATSHGVQDWNFFIAAGSAGIIAVKAESNYKTVEDLVNAAKAKPKNVKIANSGTGKLWHIKASVLEKNAGVQFMHVPYNGSNPAILSVLSGETDAVSASLSEVAEQVRAGKLRIIIITENKRVSAAAFKDIPSITEKYPASSKYFPSQQWLGIAVPKDTPKDALKVLESSFKKVMADPETDKFFEGQYLDKIALSGSDAYKFAVRMESIISWISKELGVAKVDPATLKIDKPSWAQ